MSAPRLVVVIPCLNEEAHLPALLDWLTADPLPARIVVADGGSRDASKELARAAGERDPRIAVIDNPRRLQSAAVNLAVRSFATEADLIVRIDAHAAYPADFLARLVEAQAETGADTVTVSMRAVAHQGACFQRAAATAQNSVLGAGGSPHRKGGGRVWVDHGHHALFKASAFLAAGGYDESFSHNEDAELDARLVAKGFRILLAADILIDYFPRARAAALARQYFQYGKGRARTALKHKKKLKLRQLIPIGVAPAIALGLIGAPFSPLAAAPMAAWLGLCLAYGAVLGARERSFCAGAAGAAAAVMHAAWSAGFLRQLAAGAPPEHAPAPAPARR